MRAGGPPGFTRFFQMMRGGVAWCRCRRYTEHAPHTGLGTLLRHRTPTDVPCISQFHPFFRFSFFFSPSLSSAMRSWIDSISRVEKDVRCGG